jgi:threonine dehydrogenase-like Zn-dependent dehydrogenase
MFHDRIVMHAKQCYRIAAGVPIAEPALAEPLTVRLRAMRRAISTVRPTGTILQVGVSGDVPVPLNLILGKEIAWSERTASMTNAPKPWLCSTGKTCHRAGS